MRCRGKTFPGFGKSGSGVWKKDASFFQCLEKPSSCAKRKKGLTLIEVLLAVVILGIGSGVLMLATARCLSVVAKARRYAAAQRLIRRVGAEHPLTQATLEEGIESGGFRDEPDYRWEREIMESDDENRAGLYTVRTRVSWSDRSRESFEESITWRYIPGEEQ